MSTGNTINYYNGTFNDMDSCTGRDETKKFDCIITETTYSNETQNGVLKEKSNTGNDDLAISGTFHAVLAPGEKIIIKKEKINQLNIEIMENYSQNTSSYDTLISSRLDDSTSLNNFNNIHMYHWFEQLNEEHEKTTDELNKAQEEIKEKNSIILNLEEELKKQKDEMKKLRLNVEYSKGVLNMLKPDSIKLVPRPMLIYIIVVSMFFSFSAISFTLDLFTNISVLHPFISLILAIGTLGLLLTAFSSIEDIKKHYFENLNAKGE